MKIIKKITTLLLLVCLIFTLGACGKSEGTKSKQEAPVESTESTEEGSTPLLYKVTDGKGNECWLFGSIHVGDEYFYPLPDYVNDAYEEADSLAVEADIIAFENDMAAQTGILQKLIFMDGSSVSDYISEDIYNRAVEILKENNMYLNAMDYYYPIMWSSLIDNFLIEKMDVDMELGIDRHLMERAMDEEKEILEVESVEFQYEMLANYSFELQALLLESSIAEYDDSDNAKAQMNELMETWASGDEGALIELLGEEVEFESEEEAKLYKEYNDAMIVNRNISMADYAEEALVSGKKVFICVGTAHVVGEGAMVDLLRERGCTVEIVK